MWWHTLLVVSAPSPSNRHIMHICFKHLQPKQQTSDKLTKKARKWIVCNLDSLLSHVVQLVTSHVASLPNLYQFSSPKFDKTNPNSNKGSGSLKKKSPGLPIRRVPFSNNLFGRAGVHFDCLIQKDSIWHDVHHQESRNEMRKSGVRQTSIDMNYEHTKQPLWMIKSIAGHCQQKNWENNGDWHTIWIAFWQNLGSDSSFQKSRRLVVWPFGQSPQHHHEPGVKMAKMADGFNQSFSRDIFHFNRNPPCYLMWHPEKRNTKNSQQYNSTTHDFESYTIYIVLPLHQHLHSEKNPSHSTTSRSALVCIEVPLALKHMSKGAVRKVPDLAVPEQLDGWCNDSVTGGGEKIFFIIEIMI